MIMQSLKHSYLQMLKLKILLIYTNIRFKNIHTRIKNYSKPYYSLSLKL